MSTVACLLVLAAGLVGDPVSAESVAAERRTSDGDFILLFDSTVPPEMYDDILAGAQDLDDRIDMAVPITVKVGTFDVAGGASGLSNRGDTYVSPGLDAEVPFGPSSVKLSDASAAQLLKLKSRPPVVSADFNLAVTWEGEALRQVSIHELLHGMGLVDTWDPNSPYVSESPEAGTVKRLDLGMSYIRVEDGHAAYDEFPATWADRIRPIPAPAIQSFLGETEEYVDTFVMSMLDRIHYRATTGVIDPLNVSLATGIEPGTIRLEWDHPIYGFNDGVGTSPVGYGGYAGGKVLPANYQVAVFDDTSGELIKIVNVHPGNEHGDHPNQVAEIEGIWARNWRAVFTPETVSSGTGSVLTFAGTLTTPAERPNEPLRIGTLAEARSILDLVIATDFDPAVGPDILRLYQAFFNRTPDVTGARYWLTTNQTHPNANTSNIANWFSGSNEFMNTYADTTDGEYLDTVYSNVLGRGYDQAGFNYWFDLLAGTNVYGQNPGNSRLTRAEVVFYITAGNEFKKAYPFSPTWAWNAGLR